MIRIYLLIAAFLALIIQPVHATEEKFAITWNDDAQVLEEQEPAAPQSKDAASEVLQGVPPYSEPDVLLTEDPGHFAVTKEGDLLTPEIPEADRQSAEGVDPVTQVLPPIGAAADFVIESMGCLAACPPVELPNPADGFFGSQPTDPLKPIENKITAALGDDEFETRQAMTDLLINYFSEIIKNIEPEYVYCTKKKIDLLLAVLRQGTTDPEVHLRLRWISEAIYTVVDQRIRLAAASLKNAPYEPIFLPTDSSDEPFLQECRLRYWFSTAGCTIRAVFCNSTDDGAYHSCRVSSPNCSECKRSDPDTECECQQPLKRVAFEGNSKLQFGFAETRMGARASVWGALCVEPQ